MPTALENLPISRIARETGLIKRLPRKLNAQVMLRSLLLVAKLGEPSLSAMATIASLFGGEVVSKQALWKKINEGCVQFLEKILAGAMSRAVRAHVPQKAGVFAAFGRVLLQDSTTMALPDKLSAHFPGSRNQTGKRSAVLRIQTVFDVLNDCYCDVSLSAFSRNDQAAAGDILKQVRPGDLVIRDLGYFVVGALASIAAAGGYFLSRLKNGVTVLNPGTGDTIELLPLLRRYGTVDIDILLSAGERLPSRLVAVPVPEEVAEQRRRDLLKNRDRRLKPDKTRLALLGWEIFVTNVPSTVWNAQQAAQVYGFRWRIEMLFKLWKSCLRLTDLAATPSAAQVRCLVLARIIQVVAFHQHVWVAARGVLEPKQAGRLSILKLGKICTGVLGMLIELALAGGTDPELVLRTIARHGVYETRKRKGYTEVLELYTTGMSAPPAETQLLS